MKNKNIIIANMVICLILATELAMLVSGVGVTAAIVATIVAAASLALFIWQRSGEYATAAIANVGYAIAIGTGVVISSIGFDYVSVWFGIIVGIVTILTQVGLSLAYSEGRI